MAASSHTGGLEVNYVLLLSNQNQRCVTGNKIRSDMHNIKKCAVARSYLGWST